MKAIVKKIWILLLILFFKLKFQQKISIASTGHFLDFPKIYLKKTSRIRIGEGFLSRQRLTLRCEEHANISIGDNVFFNTNVSVTALEKIVIGNNVKIANNVVVVDHDHDYKNDYIGYLTSPVMIEDNVWIGANSVILRGSHISQGAVIGAGTVVKGFIAKNTIVVGKNEHGKK